MNKTKFVIAMASLAGVIGSNTTSARAQDVVSKEVVAAGNYCHMKFPAIREDTFSESTPSLTPPGDLIDFYGSCDRDPLGKDVHR
ncbi:MAG: hypothetical protein ACREO5_01835 [Candidatus Binatia bacterium]